jgi:hypothetical protein
MRLEHVEGVEKGDLVMKVEDGSVGQKLVHCWYPEWFPVRAAIEKNDDEQ